MERGQDDPFQTALMWLAYQLRHNQVRAEMQDAHPACCRDRMHFAAAINVVHCGLKSALDALSLLQLEHFPVREYRLNPVQSNALGGQTTREAGKRRWKPVDKPGFETSECVDPAIHRGIRHLKYIEQLPSCHPPVEPLGEPRQPILRPIFAPDPGDLLSWSPAPPAPRPPGSGHAPFLVCTLPKKA